MKSIHTDLVKIREKSGLSVDDIAKKTRIPVQVIKDIEKGSIFDKAQHQKTYIRSFVRSYAKVIGVKDDDVIRSLDAYEQGNYTGFLYKKYLPVPGSEQDQTSEGDEQSSEMDDITDDGSESSILRPGPTSTIGAEEFSRPDPSRSYNKSTPLPPQLDTIDWAFVGTKLGNINSNAIMYLMAIILVGSVIIGGFYLYTYISGFGESYESQSEMVKSPSQGQSATVDAASVSSLMDVANVSAPPRVRPVPVLPDTLYIVIHASLDKLEPVRVLSDLSVRRSPYWIEHTEAMRFEFLSRIEIQGQIERMALYINGHLIPNIQSLDSGDRMLIISRDLLAENPEWFTSEAPPLPEGINEPSIIRDRPVF